jgi:hypothetical protein
MRPSAAIRSTGDARALTGAAAAAAAIGWSIVAFDPLLVLGIGVAVTVAALGATRSWGLAACAAPVLLVPVPAMQHDTVGPVPLGPLIAVSSLLYACVLFLVQRRRARMDPVVGAAAAATALIALTSAAVGGEPVVEASVTLLAVWAAGLLLGVLAADDPRRVRPLLVLLVPIALLALADAVLGRNIWEALTGPSRLSGAPSGLTRARATFGHPLVGGALFCLAGLLALTAPTVRGRTALTVLLLLAAMLTVSRAAMIGLLVGLGAYAMASGASRRRVALVALVGTVGLTALLAVPSLDRFQSTFSARIVEGRLERDARSSALQTLAEDLQERPVDLVVGSGLRAAQGQLRRRGGNRGLNSYDSQYITFVYDLGLVPTAAIIAVLALAVVRSHRRHPTLLWAPLLAGTVMFAVFDGLYWFSTALLFWLVVGWATADPGLARVAGPAGARGGGAPLPAGPARPRAPHPGSP